jgi:hypothetical protein
MRYRLEIYLSRARGGTPPPGASGAPPPPPPTLERPERLYRRDGAPQIFSLEIFFHLGVVWKTRTRKQPDLGGHRSIVTGREKTTKWNNLTLKTVSSTPLRPDRALGRPERPTGSPTTPISRPWCPPRTYAAHGACGGRSTMLIYCFLFFYFFLHFFVVCGGRTGRAPSIK